MSKQTATVLDRHTKPGQRASIEESAPPDLGQKKAPTQQRAVETYERILAACGELLGEVGIERLSTNLICQRAGISPPALYQYFPNKYAILHEMGIRLMRRQNEILAPWTCPKTMSLPAEQLIDSVVQVFLATWRLTEEMPAGVWVTRALRAVPSLQDVRIRSHDEVTKMLVQPFLESYPHVPVKQAWLLLRLAVDSHYTALELLFDDPKLDPHEVAYTMARMVVCQYVALRDGA
ncbi:MAG: TetR family transcriptional regulator [Ideonella sp. MAG2]|nr:MAG: TetR family transcriptional regulator [Ideonella sp. MAG2]